MHCVHIVAGLGVIVSPWDKMSHHLGTKCPTTLGQNVPPPWDKMSHHLGTKCSVGAGVIFEAMSHFSIVRRAETAVTKSLAPARKSVLR